MAKTLELQFATEMTLAACAGRLSKSKKLCILIFSEKGPATENGAGSFSCQNLVL